MYQEEKEQFLHLKTKVLAAFEQLQPHLIKAKLARLEEERNQPQCYTDPKKLKTVNEQLAHLEKKIAPWKKLLAALSDLETHLEIAEEAQAAEERDELTAALKEHRARFEALELLLLFKEESDQSDVYLTIHSGAGGTEACDWAAMLYRMYLRWGERTGFKTSVIDYQAGETTGVKAATLLIAGDYAAGSLRSENGVHRLVRLSPFDANQRRHTSFASVSLAPAVSEALEVKLLPSELRVDTFRSSGAGGQHVNTTDSAVRITHLPTGLVASCQAERSQHQNREKALALLKAKLYEYYRLQKEAQAQATAEEKKKIEWGSQIRSYIMHPYHLVKDHRSQHESPKVRSVLDGELVSFIYAYLKGLPKPLA